MACFIMFITIYIRHSETLVQDLLNTSQIMMDKSGVLLPVMK